MSIGKTLESRSQQRAAMPKTIDTARSDMGGPA
jgi:hypothetical protein